MIVERVGDRVLIVTRLFLEQSALHQHVDLRVAQLDPKAAHAVAPALAVTAHAFGSGGRACGHHWSLRETVCIYSMSWRGDKAGDVVRSVDQAIRCCPMSSSARGRARPPTAAAVPAVVAVRNCVARTQARSELTHGDRVAREQCALRSAPPGRRACGQAKLADDAQSHGTVERESAAPAGRGMGVTWLFS